MSQNSYGSCAGCQLSNGEPTATTPAPPPPQPTNQKDTRNSKAKPFNQALHLMCKGWAAFEKATCTRKWCNRPLVYPTLKVGRHSSAKRFNLALRPRSNGCQGTTNLNTGTAGGFEDSIGRIGRLQFRHSWRIASDMENRANLRILIRLKYSKRGLLELNLYMRWISPKGHDL